MWVRCKLMLKGNVLFFKFKRRDTSSRLFQAICFEIVLELYCKWFTFGKVDYNKLSSFFLSLVSSNSLSLVIGRAIALARTLVVGDIHGCYNLLVKGLKQAGYIPGYDRLILLGDYIDRGVDSAKVVELVRELVSKGAISLMGNHEDMIRDTLDDWEAKNPYWFLNGARNTLLSYGVDSKQIRDRKAVMRAIPREHLDFFESLPL